MIQTSTPQKVKLAEAFARILVILLILGVGSSVGVKRWIANQVTDERIIEIHARMPEAGGWTPADLTAQIGETIRLRLTSDDVVHGFAIGGDQTPVSIDVEPGTITEVNLTFNQPGKYTYYCTRWCGLNHWRMRGTIEVTGPETQSAEQPTPMYLNLGLDIDAPHPAGVTPQIEPSASRGAELAISLPEFLDREYYRSHSPAEIWQNLRGEPSLETLSDEQIWDLVAYVWWINTTPQALEEGQQLYAVNCAACHGEIGAGDGVMADKLAATGDASISGEHEPGHKPTKPADFTQAETMLGASPALLQGKILRGGMGTGMPYWGPIFSDSKTWAIVDYLWTFQFQKEENQ